jgi:hypothetical protein
MSKYSFPAIAFVLFSVWMLSYRKCRIIESRKINGRWSISGGGSG